MDKNEKKKKTVGISQNIKYYANTNTITNYVTISAPIIIIRYHIIF